jgi:hypothetical protein
MPVKRADRPIRRRFGEPEIRLPHPKYASNLFPFGCKASGQLKARMAIAFTAETNGCATTPISERITPNEVPNVSFDFISAGPDYGRRRVIWQHNR